MRGPGGGGLEREQRRGGGGTRAVESRCGGAGGGGMSNRERRPKAPQHTHKSREEAESQPREDARGLCGCGKRRRRGNRTMAWVGAPRLRWAWLGGLRAAGGGRRGGVEERAGRELWGGALEPCVCACARAPRFVCVRAAVCARDCVSPSHAGGDTASRVPYLQHAARLRTPPPLSGACGCASERRGGLGGRQAAHGGLVRGETIDVAAALSSMALVYEQAQRPPAVHEQSVQLYITVEQTSPSSVHLYINSGGAEQHGPRLRAGARPSRVAPGGRRAGALGAGGWLDRRVARRGRRRSRVRVGQPARGCRAGIGPPAPG